MACDDLIQMFLDTMQERGCTKASQRTYARVLMTVDRDLPYGLCSNEDELRPWLWRSDLADSSRVTYISVLNGFYRWAISKGQLDYNPVDGINAPKVVLGLPRVAVDDHVQIATTTAPEPYRLWAILAAYDGMRCIEIARSRREHFTEATTRIERGKGNKPRVVKTHPLVWQAVRDLPPGPITDCDEDRISRYFLRWCTTSGLRGLSMHRLRGWYCTHGYRATKDIRAQQRNMGHADPGTTARYIDVADDQMAAGVMGLPVFELASAG